MPTPMMTGDPNLQAYLNERKREYRIAGYSQREINSLAFRDMLQAKRQGYIPDIPEAQQAPELDVVYSDR